MLELSKHSILRGDTLQAEILLQRQQGMRNVVCALHLLNLELLEKELGVALRQAHELGLFAGFRDKEGDGFSALFPQPPRNGLCVVQGGLEEDFPGDVLRLEIVLLQEGSQDLSVRLPLDIPQVVVLPAHHLAVTDSEYHAAGVVRLRRKRYDVPVGRVEVDRLLALAVGLEPPDPVPDEGRFFKAPLGGMFLHLSPE
jgi:hypothetical protein